MITIQAHKTGSLHTTRPTRIHLVAARLFKTNREYKSRRITYEQKQFDKNVKLLITLLGQM